MTEREALKLALEALETGLCYVENEDFDNKQKFRGYEHLMPTDAAESIQEIKTAIAAVKEALAQPEQEPVAWLHTKIEGVAVPHRPADLDKHPDRWEALYKTPSPCPTCEALARTVMLDQTSYDTTPPQRTWVGLTDEDKQTAFDETQEGGGFWEFADAIETKLKEKNT